MSRAIDGAALTEWISGECKSLSCPKNESAFGMRIIKHIERMPTIEPELKWIPVSERLPEENMWTICQNNAGAMMIGKYNIEFGWMFPAYFDGIVAWMPLPEPYREEGDQDG